MSGCVLVLYMCDCGGGNVGVIVVYLYCVALNSHILTDQIRIHMRCDVMECAV